MFRGRDCELYDQQMVFDEESFLQVQVTFFNEIRQLYTVLAVQFDQRLSIVTIQLLLSLVMVF